MFCTKCGSQNEDGSKFCGKCGEALATYDNATHYQNNQPQQITSVSGSKKPPIPLIIGIVVGVIICVVVAVIVIKSKDGDSDLSSGNEVGVEEGGSANERKKEIAESNAKSVYAAASGFQAATNYKLTDTIITATTENPDEYGKTFADFIGSGMTGEYRAIVGDDGMITQADWTNGKYTATYKVENGRAYIASAKGGELGGAIVGADHTDEGLAEDEIENSDEPLIFENIHDKEDNVEAPSKTSEELNAENYARSVYSAACGFAAAADNKLTGIIDTTTHIPDKPNDTFGRYLGNGIGEYRAIANDAGEIIQADWTDGEYTASFKIEDDNAYVASAKGGELGGATDFRMFKDSDYDSEEADEDEDEGTASNMSAEEIAEVNARHIYSASSGFQLSVNYKLTGIIDAATPNPDDPGETLGDFIGSGMNDSNYRAIVGDDGKIKQADWTDGEYTASYKVEDGKAYVASAKGGELGGAKNFREIN